MFERPQRGERAVLVHLNLDAESAREDLEEFRELALSAGAVPVAVIQGARKTPDPKYFVGSGKAEEIRSCVLEMQAELVLINHSITPSQERNLESLLKCRVLDRTGLILDIFAQRARSFEGKLQVELAQLKHLSTRLVRGWTHLERQKGGIGLRGPGETQLETDRRLIGHRIKQLNKRLEKVGQQHEERRKSRLRAGIPVVSLVGYTNAGKSTLFNRLTGAEVYAADQLFATLDPTLRRVPLPGARAIILADTVGFIRHLPHNLVAAFQSTLEETKEADLLLHVVDAASEQRREQILQVNEVLKEIGAESVPQIEVYNKIDKMEACAPRVDYDEASRAQRVWVSARSGEGLEMLLEAIATHFQGIQAGDGQPVWPKKVRMSLMLSPEAGRLRASLYEKGAVLQESSTPDGGWLLEAELWEDDVRILGDEPGCALLPAQEQGAVHSR